MNITFDELRKVKHQLPTGSVKRIAEELDIDEQTVRNYFGAKKFENGAVVGSHIEPGPHGGIVQLDDDRILNIAKRIISDSQALKN
ncbi:MAG: DNA-binding protein [Saprospiraceae bacterium]